MLQISSRILVISGSVQKIKIGIWQQTQNVTSNSYFGDADISTDMGKYDRIENE